MQIADGKTSTYFLTTFGRAKRETVCACEATTDPTLSQALHLLNGDAVQGKITRGGVVKKLLDEGKTPEQVIESLYRPLPDAQADARRDRATGGRRHPVPRTRRPAWKMSSGPS